MKPLNEIVLTMPSRSSNESFARAAVASFFTQLDPTVEELCDIRTAVSEAVTNAIVHGYRDTVGNIRITARIYPDRRVTIAVRDQGCGIPDISQAMEPLFTTKPDSERCGMGFAFMEAFMDEISVTSKVGEGTRVDMKKIIGRGNKFDQ